MNNMAIHNILSEEFTRMRESEKGKYVLLDVRSTEEWNEGHFEEALLLPLSIIPVKVQEVVPNKEQKIIVYCMSGGRSGMAASLLDSMGYKNVFNLLGGYSRYHK